MVIRPHFTAALWSSAMETPPAGWVASSRQVSPFLAGRPLALFPSGWQLRALSLCTVSYGKGHPVLQPCPSSTCVWYVPIFTLVQPPKSKNSHKPPGAMQPHRHLDFCPVRLILAFWPLELEIINLSGFKPLSLSWCHSNNSMMHWLLQK